MRISVSTHRFVGRYLLVWGFSDGSDSKEFTCNVRDLGLIPGLGRSLEEGVATHSSMAAWRVPWVEEPGGLESTGSQRAGHDSAQFLPSLLVLSTVEKKRHTGSN